jgi:hypothetical protein
MVLQQWAFVVVVDVLVFVDRYSHLMDSPDLPLAAAAVDWPMMMMGLSRFGPVGFVHLLEFHFLLWELFHWLVPSVLSFVVAGDFAVVPKGK